MDFPEIFRTISHVLRIGVLEESLLTYSLQDCRLAERMVRRAKALERFKERRFSGVGDLLNKRKARFLCRIASLQTLVNQGRHSRRGTVEV